MSDSEGTGFGDDPAAGCGCLLALLALWGAAALGLLAFGVLVWRDWP